MTGIVNKLSRVVALGPRNSYYLLNARLQQHMWQYWYKQPALRKIAHSQWTDVLRWYPHLRNKPVASNVTVKALMAVVQDKAVERANHILQNTFFLFNRQIHLSQIDWHSDFLSEQADKRVAPLLWYADITVAVGQSNQLHNDIRVPWELSRFSFAWQLAYAFVETKDKRYVDHLVYLMQHWIEHNPYMLGINWACPMEVALRALNWVIALSVLPSDVIATASWNGIVTSLYDHMRYLEHNWEWYDGRTSNHYISNLVGYIALCHFFNEYRKGRWAFNQLSAEFEKQVFEEGAHYEGSTAYHILVTELLVYGFAFSIDMQLPVPAAQMEKLQRMFQFIDWCGPDGGSAIVIGDTDSSVAVTGLPPALRAQALSLLCGPALASLASGIRTFKDFGISFIKTATWHVSLRHPVYHRRQPSGHFHVDAGSVTVACKGTAVFVDPGSYVYSASAVWRNYFRSAQVHNNFIIEGIEPLELGESLFTLPLPEQKPSPLVRDFATWHDLYKAYGLRAHRKVQIAAAQDRITLVDWWQEIQPYDRSGMSTRWLLRLAPGLRPNQINPQQVIIPIAHGIVAVTAEYPVQVETDFVATSYGYKEQCYVIRLTLPLVVDKRHTLIIAAG